MFQTKVVEKIKTLILRSIYFFNLVLYVIMWTNTVKPVRSKIISFKYIARWIPKATNIYTQVV
jgi:hypothetical protein